MKNLRKMWTLIAVAVAALALPSTLAAQTPAAIHGKVTNPAGSPYNHGDVKLTTEKTVQPKDRKYAYSFPIDATGNYSGKGISPGAYIAVVFADDKTPDYQEVTLKFGDDRTVDFDMTRAEYLKGMSAEDKAALEEYKKKNAAISAENTKIGNINAVLTQARLDEKNGKPDDAVKALTELTQQKPDESILWASLGEAQLASADAAFAAAKAAKTSTNDPALQQKYLDSAASYQKAVDLSASSKKPNSEVVSKAYQNMAVALAKAGKIPEATQAYENEVKALPSSAATAYSNEAATFYNAGKLDEAAAAADKGIAADPKRAVLYYIKAQSLVPKATMDPKTNKFLAPPGCIEAYQEYLELEPTGAHAGEVKELLVNFGQPVKNSFKAGKK